MTSFLNKKDLHISKEFETKGYIIKDIEDKLSLKKIQYFFMNEIKKNLKIKKDYSNLSLLNNIHKFIKPKNLNEFRLKIINAMKSNKDFRKLYYLTSKYYLETLIGNELAMQQRVNLSIQMPNDVSSLLPVHSDVWSGDSPFEIVVWLPLVDCYKTKTMYILPPKKNKKINLSESKSSKNIFEKIKKDVVWPEVKFGQVLIFNQMLAHGNVVNLEKETRWSMNCRFKSIFTPYGDKKLGEFFEPITLRKASQLGMKYKDSDNEKI